MGTKKSRGMAYSHNNQKKIAVINDFTGFGRCSLTVFLPIVSALKVQCCAIPTALLSAHTAYDEFYLRDCTADLPPYIANWKHLGLQFSGIATGYFGSPAQFAIAKDFIADFRSDNTLVLVDPVMADDGVLYEGFTEKTCERMRSLVPDADLLTPNVTEACLLTGTPYHEGSWRRRELEVLTEQLAELGAKNIVITGIPAGTYVANACREKGGDLQIFRTLRSGQPRSGTGDVFSAILIADAVNGRTLPDSVQHAARFIQKCMIKSEEMKIPPEDGVCFEELLDIL
jgi:pyridoxine kinase